MCGIYGVRSITDGIVPIESILHSLSNKLTHRGPDDNNQVSFPHGGIGARRLSIVSPSNNIQPVHNEDKSVWAVMNGEIYNYQKLRQKLSRSHKLNQDGDTEVIVHLYEEYGDRMVEHLQGMYAIAIWDSRTQKLILIRDRFGEKPLYILQCHNWIAFSSEVSALLSLPEFNKYIELTSVIDYMSFGFVSGSMTLIQQVRKLPPATITYLDQSLHLHEHKYWSLPEPSNEEDKVSTDYQSTIDNLTNELQKACIHLYEMSAAPVGLFLSGGIDSSIIASLLATGGIRDFQAFTLDYPSINEFTDAKYANQLAKSYGFTHHLVKVTKEDLWNILPILIKYIDEPCDDPSALPLLLLSQYAARRVKVVLCGAGADELFGGYEVHWDAIQSAPSFGGNRSFWHQISLLNRSRALRLFAPKMIEHCRDIELGEWFSDRWAPHYTKDPTWNVLATDLNYRLPDQLLAIGDRLTMAASLEARAPFLTKDFAEKSIQLPSSWKIGRRKRKGVLRDIAGLLLPMDVISRPKQGLPSPLLTVWFDFLVLPLWSTLRADLPFYFTKVFNISTIDAIEENAMKDNPLAKRFLWRLTLLTAWLKDNQITLAH